MDISKAKWRLYEDREHGDADDRCRPVRCKYLLVMDGRVLAGIHGVLEQFWMYTPYIDEYATRAGPDGDRWDKNLGHFTSLPIAKAAVKDYFDNLIGLPDREGH